MVKKLAVIAIGSLALASIISANAAPLESKKFTAVVANGALPYIKKLYTHSPWITVNCSAQKTVTKGASRVGYNNGEMKLITLIDSDHQKFSLTHLKPGKLNDGTIGVQLQFDPPASFETPLSPSPLSIECVYYYTK
ncbi:hypothetical protein CbuD7D7780_02645 [Coxiella burnetii]|uniref:Uncharacterized protein n=1 Tax=Coxiella burnetii (strain Dugway 5J108-111) TaxID=434922 RepID=A9KBH8_COXBN|nr:hypothetical protein [Coxiella burnetii]ABS76685.1 hypothetical protein CBUD_0516 [Coxiella burnetii Dugway 5J108-111]OYK80745.1 hypothetical protein CbuD7E6568_02635 [Coxiella burnetii]OYK82832.1 hypothetical protein CbuD7D7780_02645 [Coxiella burnetii]